VVGIFRNSGAIASHWVLTLLELTSSHSLFSKDRVSGISGDLFQKMQSLILCLPSESAAED